MQSGGLAVLASRRPVAARARSCTLVHAFCRRQIRLVRVSSGEVCDGERSSLSGTRPATVAVDFVRCGKMKSATRNETEIHNRINNRKVMNRYRRGGVLTVTGGSLIVRWKKKEKRCHASPQVGDRICDMEKGVGVESLLFCVSRSLVCEQGVPFLGSQVEAGTARFGQLGSPFLAAFFCFFSPLK